MLYIAKTFMHILLVVFVKAIWLSFKIRKAKNVFISIVQDKSIYSLAQIVYIHCSVYTI